MAGWIFVGLLLLIVVISWTFRKHQIIGIKRSLLLLGVVYLTVTRWKAAILSLIFALIPLGPDASRFARPSVMDNWFVAMSPPIGLSNSYLYSGNHTWLDFAIQIATTLLITALILLLIKRFPIEKRKGMLK